jgi:Zn-dependent peptidase ImmA (M78 family)
MLHLDAYDVTKVKESKEEEQEADRFAGHFLMPNEGFRKEWNEAAGLHFVDRVFKVKRIFRVSYKTVLSRLLEEEAVDKSIWMKFNMAYQQHFLQGRTDGHRSSGAVRDAKVRFLRRPIQTPDQGSGGKRQNIPQPRRGDASDWH